MTLESAKKLQKNMPYKKIFYDAIEECYRLIDPSDWYEWKDEEGRIHKRNYPEKLIPIHS